MAQSLRTRTVLYGLTLAIGICENIISCFAAVFSGFAPYMDIFAGIAAGWALLTWVWTSVLLSYNNRPASSHRLVRASSHFVSFTILAIGWFGLFIMLGTRFPLQCNFKRDSDGEAASWCSMGATSFALSVILCIFCSASASVIYHSSLLSGAGLSANIAHK